MENRWVFLKFGDQEDKATVLFDGEDRRCRVDLVAETPQQKEILDWLKRQPENGKGNRHEMAAKLLLAGWDHLEGRRDMPLPAHACHPIISGTSE